MKNYLTAAALLAAGTVFANASVVLDTTVVQSGLTLNGGGYNGISFSLEDSSLSAESYSLDSLRIFGRYSNQDSTLSGSETLVVYSVAENGSFSFLGMGGTTLDTSASSRFYDENGGYYSRYSLVGTFSDVDLDLTSSYVVLFTESYSGNEETFKTATALSAISSLLSTEQLSAVLKTSINEGPTSGFYNTSGATADTYSPVISLTLTAIPEPSAFGLLAGAGALALVAARRRRRAK